MEGEGAERSVAPLEFKWLTVSIFKIKNIEKKIRFELLGIKRTFSVRFLNYNSLQPPPSSLEGRFGIIGGGGD